MKLPIPSSQTSKHTRLIPSNTNTTPSNYEPTSVLDLRRSPSPVCGKPVVISDPSLEWEDHVLQNFDWDSIMKELDFHDENNPNSKGELIIPDLSSHHPPLTHPLQLLNHPDFNDICFNNLNIPSDDSISLNLSSFDLIQELIRAADCVDSNEIQLAQSTLDRLNHRLQSPVGKPLQRAAFFFKEALQSLLTANSPPRITSWSDVVNTIKAYKVFSSISPIPMFNHITVNQALLETLMDSPPFIHVIDFHIGLGCHYASFMRELVEKADYGNKIVPPVLRITAVVPEDYAIQTQLIKQCLSQYAIELKIRFQIEFVLVRTFETVSFKSIKFIDGEKTAVLLSPAFFRSNISVNNFVTDLRRISPGVIVVVDHEGWAESGGGASFRRNFVNGLEYFAMVFESIDAAVAAGGGGDWGRKIEMFLLKPMIIAAVEGCGRRASPPWREVLGGAGMRQWQFSQFADFQAECLLGKVQVRGFYVAKRQAEMVLCWHERPIISTSAWKC
ncbi:GRAS family transcription factor [Euphorbia peplus]|nr:GRAS family transcription factor [Euphorbia peplus]